MADSEEHDRRRWLFAQKFDKPVDAYEEMVDSVEEAMAIDESPIDIHPLKNWLRA